MVPGSDLALGRRRRRGAEVEPMDIDDPLREPLVELVVRGREPAHERIGPRPLGNDDDQAAAVGILLQPRPVVGEPVSCVEVVELRLACPTELTGKLRPSVLLARHARCRHRDRSHDVSFPLPFRVPTQDSGIRGDVSKESPRPRGPSSARPPGGKSPVQPGPEAACNRMAPATPLSSTGPISRNATSVPLEASTTSWLTSTSRGRA